MVIIYFSFDNSQGVRIIAVSLCVMLCILNRVFLCFLNSLPYLVATSYFTSCWLWLFQSKSTLCTPLVTSHLLADILYLSTGLHGDDISTRIEGLISNNSLNIITFHFRSLSLPSFLPSFLLASFLLASFLLLLVFSYISHIDQLLLHIHMACCSPHFLNPHADISFDLIISLDSIHYVSMFINPFQGIDNESEIKSISLCQKRPY